jgi:hypothetical protein
MNTRILFLVEMGNIHVLTYSWNREQAKRDAHKWMGGDADNYIVSPLTEPGDRIRLQTDEVSATIYI